MSPIALLTPVPGIGRILAERLHEELGLEALAGVEAAAHDGRLARVAGFGEKRLAAVRDSLTHRLGRVRLLPISGTSPAVSELLDVDREYREKAATGQLQRITPRRFNPMRDWVILYGDNGSGDTRHTVITAMFGPLRGRRVVAGREDDCRAFYDECQRTGPIPRVRMAGAAHFPDHVA